jgi:hypothetical protein
VIDIKSMPRYEFVFSHDLSSSPAKGTDMYTRKTRNISSENRYIGKQRKHGSSSFHAMVLLRCHIASRTPSGGEAFNEVPYHASMAYRTSARAHSTRGTNEETRCILQINHILSCEERSLFRRAPCRNPGNHAPVSCGLLISSLQPYYSTFLLNMQHFLLNLFVSSYSAYKKTKFRIQRFSEQEQSRRKRIKREGSASSSA